MIYLLLLSKEGRWARDPYGKQWILRPRREEDTNYCSECPHPSPDNRIAVGQSAWVTRQHSHGLVYYDRSVCQACADVQHPIEG
jgi:hypothetical protein